MQTAHEFSFNDIDGQKLDLKNFSGKVLLIVNVASKCGFTGQYAGLQELHASYADKGFSVIAVPSNDFGAQEPDQCPIIKDFAQGTYNVTFPMTDKYAVIGDNAHPFYKWANDNVGFVGKPRWNFHKYLIDQNGKLLEWFLPTTKPNSQNIKNAIDKALEKT
ncbi:MAG: glutathione peroxidase [Pseudomonadota bacterium]